MKFNKTKTHGYTLIELMMVVVIISLIASITAPRFDILLTKAYQSKSKGNLGNLRSALNLYYADLESHWPLMEYPEGDSFYSNDHISLSTILAPKYISVIPTPKFNDHTNQYNGRPINYDDAADTLMSLTPPKDVYIIWGPADYTFLLNSPFGYDNKTGLLYYSNGNYDTVGNYFYTW
jgi:prepilin-type N-terminal cleavage/methylation domain-containing protein